MATPIFTKLAVQNFRAIGPSRVEIQLAPLTVLVGENGSGKSSLLQALALTAQSALEDPLRSDLILDGGIVSLGYSSDKNYREQFREILFRKDDQLAVSVFIEASVEPKSWPVAARERPQSKSPDEELFKEWPPASVGYQWTRRGIAWPSFSHEFTADGRPLLSVNAGYEQISENSATPRVVARFMGSKDPMNERVLVGRSPDRVLSDDFAKLKIGDLVASPGEQLYGYAGAVVEPVRAITAHLRARLGGVSLVEPMRGRQLAHRDIGPEVSFVGPHGEMLVRFLSLLKNRASLHFEKFRAWADRFGVKGVETGTGGENELKIAFRDPLTGTPLELSEAATGSYQALLMAAQLLLSKEGSVLLYEEPENNLHPRFEKLLPALYADAIRTGHQLIVTTHSEVLVAAIGNEVRKGTLSDRDVAVWELSRSMEACSARRIRVSDRGYLEGWVRSFARVEQEMFDEWTNTLPEEGERKHRGHAPARRGRSGSKKKSGRTSR